MELDFEGQQADRAYPILASLVKRLHLRDEFFDAEILRVHADRLFLIGRMAAPHGYCRTRDRFEMIRPK